jgi:hypothetical protein
MRQTELARYRSYRLRIFSVRCARDKRRRSLREKCTVPNRANYRDKFARNESFDIGGAMALPGLIPLMFGDVNR